MTGDFERAESGRGPAWEADTLPAELIPQQQTRGVVAAKAGCGKRIIPQIVPQGDLFGRVVPLTRGHVTLVSPADIELVTAFNWRALNGGSRRLPRTYAGRTEGGRLVMLHRFLLGVVDPTVLVDHINGDSLDNRRENLRVCTKSQNNANSPRRRGSSRFKGVSRRSGAWEAVTSHEGRTVHIARFPQTPEGEIAAARAYDEWARRVFGEYARLNFPRPGERGALPGRRAAALPTSWDLGARGGAG